MPRRLFVIPTAVLAISAGIVIANAQPRVFLLDAPALESSKASLAEPARTAADKVMYEGPFSVLDKSRVAPSADKHDYMSQAPYFWPNPKTPDHLPYIRRDGERNAEINKITDHSEMDRVARDSRLLAIAYFLTRDEKYAERAALLLRAWFLNPETRMNPNLNFAQAVLGVNDGRGIGIIESRGLTSVVDAIGLLQASQSWTTTDQNGIERWFRDFLDWLETSKNGRDESNATNNHGTFYDVQIADFALFTGQRDLATRTLDEAKKKRIAAQIEPNGRQPKETDRTKGLSYSVMNLEGMFELAQLGDRTGVDLWSFETKDGRGIRKALDWLVPYIAGENKWTYEQIEPYQPADFVRILLWAVPKYGARYLEVANQVDRGADFESQILRVELKRPLRSK